MPSSPQPVAELLAALHGALAALGVRWFLFGAQAAILHGAARLSADVDVTVDRGRRSATELVVALAAAGFELRVPVLQSGTTAIDRQVNVRGEGDAAARAVARYRRRGRRES